MKYLRFNEIERNYVSYYLKKNMRLLIVLGIILILLMSESFLPAQAVLFFTRSFVGPYNDGVSYNLQLLSVCICVLAFLVPLYQYHFMMKRASCDLYLSLPIKRERLFYVQFVIGVGIVAGMTSIIYLIVNIVFANANSISDLKSLILFLIIEGLGIFLYTFYTWLCVKCNSLLDAVVIMIAYSMIPIFIHISLQAFIETITQQLMYASNWGNSAGLSDAFWIITGFLSIPWVMRSTLYLSSTYVFVGSLDANYIGIGYFVNLLVWFLLTILLFNFAKKQFVSRKGEDSEHRTNKLSTYPLLIPAIAISLLFMTGIYMDTMLWVFIIFVLYLCMHFFMVRKIKFRWQVIVQYICIVLAIGGLQTILLRTNAFGTVIEVPDRDDVKSVSLILYELVPSQDDGVSNSALTYISSVTRDEDKISELINIQNQIMVYSQKEDPGGGQFTFSYIMKDGTYDSRSYMYDSASYTSYVKPIVEELRQAGFLFEEEYNTQE